MLVGWHFRPLVALKPSPESKHGEFVFGPCVRFSFASLLIKLVLIFNTKIVGSHFFYYIAHTQVSYVICIKVSFKS